MGGGTETTQAKSPTKNVARTGQDRTTGNKAQVVTSVLVILDKPVASGDAFTLDHDSGATRTKTPADATDIDATHAAIKLDKIKDKGRYALSHRRGKTSKIVLFKKAPAGLLIFPGEHAPNTDGKTFFRLLDPAPKPGDPELAADAPDFAKIQVKEPKAS